MRQDEFFADAASYAELNVSWVGATVDRCTGRTGQPETQYADPEGLLLAAISHAAGRHRPTAGEMRAIEVVLNGRIDPGAAVNGFDVICLLHELAGTAQPLEAMRLAMRNR